MWVMCEEGCGLHHREGDKDPLHDPRWLLTQYQTLKYKVVALKTQIHLMELEHPKPKKGLLAPLPPPPEPC